MTSSNPIPPRLRVALAAAPPLLADAIRSLLEGDVDVTLVLAGSDEHFDLAITTAGAPRILADITIELDASPGTQGGGTVDDSRRAGRQRLTDLAAVLGFVREVVASG